MKTLTTGLPRHRMHEDQRADSPIWDPAALCNQTDPEAFYPDKGDSPKDAKRVCNNCEISPKCLAWALLTNQQFGVWGGLTAIQRRKLKRKEREAQAAQA